MIYAENILVCIAVPLMVALFFLRGSAAQFVRTFLVGMGTCLIAAYISGYIGDLSGLDQRGTSVYISPMTEEVAKTLPILFYLLSFYPGRDGLYLSAIGIGTGFATFENCCYILTAGAGNFTYILIRGMAVGVMHAVSILIFSVMLDLLWNAGALSLPGFVGALSVPVTFHGLYNLLVSKPGVSSVIGYGMPMFVSLVLYLPYRNLRFREEE